jgi:hypothetical protein
MQLKRVMPPQPYEAYQLFSARLIEAKRGRSSSELTGNKGFRVRRRKSEKGSE